MKHLPAKKNATRMRTTSESTCIEILADSLEVMEDYCREKIRSLEASLNLLSIADHTAEIISICRNIKKERIVLSAIVLRKKRAGYGC